MNHDDLAPPRRDRTKYLMDNDEMGNDDIALPRRNKEGQGT